MDRENRVERRLDRLIARAGTPRTAAAVIATVTTTITVAAGLLMSVIDHKGFPTIGTGLWWAVQTVTTVGYGDRVPVTAAGQILAAVVMLLGIGFVTVITASITGAFVSRTRKEQTTDTAQSADQLQDIVARLERIEGHLNQPT
jgi:voltage-gated potassium channel